MEGYYRKRAREYEEEFYRGSNSVRQKELESIADASKEVLKARTVLDVACGTGYWIEIVSETAQSIVGTDIAEEMLEIAKQKQFRCPVSFCKADVFDVPFRNSAFNGGMADFWFSHIPRERIVSFLQDFHRLLKSKSIVFIADNVLIPGVGGEFIKREDDVNTYKLRKLRDGSEHLILKNYFSAEELVRIFGRYTRGFSKQNIFLGQYFWYLFYELK